MSSELRIWIWGSWSGTTNLIGLASFNTAPAGTPPGGARPFRQAGLGSQPASNPNLLPAAFLRLPPAREGREERRASEASGEESFSRGSAATKPRARRGLLTAAAATLSVDSKLVQSRPLPFRTPDAPPALYCLSRQKCRSLLAEEKPHHPK